MAAHDYYSPFNTQNSVRPSMETSGQESRLPHPGYPRLPPSYHSRNEDRSPSPVSPVGSPFADHSNLGQQSSSASLPHYTDHGISHSPDPPRHYARDPFGDKNAIQLQTQGFKQDPQVMISPTADMSLAENGLVEPRRRKSKRRRHHKKKGPITWACYILTTIQIIVFIYSVVRNSILTGSPIEIHPTFNPMVGPSPYVLINVGARYVPCMRQYDVPNTTLTLASNTVGMPCPNTTTGTVPTTGYCTLADLCGMGLDLTPGTDGIQPQPNQWWRFITPIFLHGGFIHIGFNLLLQMTLGREIEQQIGTIRFLIVYFSAGIFGFVFGGNFAPSGLPSTGCSGALFGILAIVLLDLLYTWKTRPKPVRDLLFIVIDILIAFVIGLLPALDNFSHIGGFLTGLVLGICILHSPDSLRERMGEATNRRLTMNNINNAPGYETVNMSGALSHSHQHDPLHISSPIADEPKPVELSSAAHFAKRPVGFFKDRKPLWWGWWLVRACSLVAILVIFILLIRNFYVNRNTCSWCKYLSCLVSLFLFSSLPLDL